VRDSVQTATHAMFAAGGLLPTAEVTHIDEAKAKIKRLDYTHKNTYISHMRYTYDPKKQSANLKKHGYDFEAVPEVIESGRTVIFEDRRFDYGEKRFITFGLLHGEVVVITTTETDDEIRIISMRKAEKHEQKIYYSNL
jgi:uncharacterized DUF497 family protein